MHFSECLSLLIAILNAIYLGSRPGIMVCHAVHRNLVFKNFFLPENYVLLILSTIIIEEYYP